MAVSDFSKYFFDMVSLKGDLISTLENVKNSSYYPYNPSLDEEMERLFPPAAKPSQDLETVMEEFRSNGVDCEYCPEFDMKKALGAPSFVTSTPIPIPARPSTSDSESLSPLSPPPYVLERGMQVLRSTIFKHPNFQRDKRMKKPLPTECVFCRNNGEQEFMYKSHYLKDQNGRVMCPVLRKYRCPICEAWGDAAHTLKYCPQNKNKDSLPNMEDLKQRSSIGQLRNFNKTVSPPSDNANRKYFPWGI